MCSINVSYYLVEFKSRLPVSLQVTEAGFKLRTRAFISKLNSKHTHPIREWARASSSQRKALWPRLLQGTRTKLSPSECGQSPKWDLSLSGGTAHLEGSIKRSKTDQNLPKKQCDALTPWFRRTLKKITRSKCEKRSCPYLPRPRSRSEGTWAAQLSTV